MALSASRPGSAVSTRATSSATLPVPTTTTRSALAASTPTASAPISGWPLYQPTTVVEGRFPASSSPGTPRVFEVGAPTA
jgi:hypothetical protein